MLLCLPSWGIAQDKTPGADIIRFHPETERYTVGDHNAEVLRVNRAGEVLASYKGFKNPIRLTVTDSEDIVIADFDGSEVVKMTLSGEVTARIRCKGRPLTAREIPGGAFLVGEHHPGFLSVYDATGTQQWSQLEKDCSFTEALPLSDGKIVTCLSGRDQGSN